MNCVTVVTVILIVELFFQNFVYKPTNPELHWVGMYGDSIFNQQRNEYYTLLPDPQQEDKLYRHIAVIKVCRVEYAGQTRFSNHTLF